jgi:hypothetical protein
VRSSDCSADAAGSRPELENLTPLPRPLAELHGRLEQGELVHPGREAARATEVVEPRENAHERIVRGLERDLAQFVSAQVGQTRSATSDLEPRRAEQECVQPRDGRVAHGPVVTQVPQPGARFLVELPGAGR